MFFIVVFEALTTQRETLAYFVLEWLVANLASDFTLFPEVYLAFYPLA